MKLIFRGEKKLPGGGGGASRDKKCQESRKKEKHRYHIREIGEKKKGEKTQQRAGKKKHNKTPSSFESPAYFDYCTKCVPREKKNERPSTFILCRFMPSTKKEKEIFCFVKIFKGT